jgi:fused signal recognition particle receptor
VNVFARLKQGLSKTRGQISAIVGERKVLDEAFLDALEEALVGADVGLERSLEILSRLRAEVARVHPESRAEAAAILKKMLAADLHLVKLPEDRKSVV